MNIAIKRKLKFKYMKDPLFHTAVILYVLNRFIFKPLTIAKTDFFHSYFNDLICIPFCLPIILFLTKAVKLRNHDQPPDCYELCFYLVLWSFCFEYIAPLYGKHLNYPVADPFDVVCYAIGALIAGIYWNFKLSISVNLFQPEK